MILSVAGIHAMPYNITIQLSKLHIGFKEPISEKCYFHIYIDQYWKHPEISILFSTGSKKLLSILDHIFTTRGISHTIITNTQRFCTKFCQLNLQDYTYVPEKNSPQNTIQLFPYAILNSLTGNSQATRC